MKLIREHRVYAGYLYAPGAWHLTHRLTQPDLPVDDPPFEPGSFLFKRVAGARVVCEEQRLSPPYKPGDRPTPGQWVVCSAVEGADLKWVRYGETVYVRRRPDGRCDVLRAGGAAEIRTPDDCRKDLVMRWTARPDAQAELTRRYEGLASGSGA